MRPKSKVRYKCPLCGAVLRGDASMEGEAATCPRCKGEVEEWPAPIDEEDDARPARTHEDDESVPDGLLIACVSTTAAAAACVAMPFIWACGAPLAAFGLVSCLIVGTRRRGHTGLTICAVVAAIIVLGCLVRGSEASDDLRKLASVFKN